MDKDKICRVLLGQWVQRSLQGSRLVWLMLSPHCGGQKGGLVRRKGRKLLETVVHVNQDHHMHRETGPPIITGWVHIQPREGVVAF